MTEGCTTSRKEKNKKVGSKEKLARTHIVEAESPGYRFLSHFISADQRKLRKLGKEGTGKKKEKGDRRKEKECDRGKGTAHARTVDCTRTRPQVEERRGPSRTRRAE